MERNVVSNELLKLITLMITLTVSQVFTFPTWKLIKNFRCTWPLSDYALQSHVVLHHVFHSPALKTLFQGPRLPRRGKWGGVPFMSMFRLRYDQAP